MAPRLSGLLLLLAAVLACGAHDNGKLRRTEAILTTKGELKRPLSTSADLVGLEAVVADICGADAACAAQRAEEWRLGTCVRTWGVVGVVALARHH